MVHLPAEGFIKKEKTIAKSFLYPLDKNALLGKMRAHNLSENYFYVSIWALKLSITMGWVLG
jgi:hypothetical protein